MAPILATRIVDGVYRDEPYSIVLVFILLPSDEGSTREEHLRLFIPSVRNKHITKVDFDQLTGPIEPNTEEGAVTMTRRYIDYLLD